ncbi:MAG: hypothetical protein ACREX8_20325, partial [Gammaproteobacteria bacterium]
MVVLRPRLSAVLSDRPSPERVRALLGRYVPVRLDLDSAHLVPGDRRALGRLVEAATWIDRIYWRQRSEVGLQLKASLMDGKDAAARELERLLTLNFGPWDTLNDNEPFWG